jgi:hypothetical protein
MLPLLDERQARLFLALEANALGRGGVKLVHKISGVSQTTIIRGEKGLEEGIAPEGGRARKVGGGRRKLTQKYDDIKDAIGRIVSGNDIKLQGDSGFQGIAKLHANNETPKKSSKKNPLTDEEKANNRRIAQERVLDSVYTS